MYVDGMKMVVNGKGGRGREMECGGGGMGRRDGNLKIEIRIKNVQWHNFKFIGGKK